MKKIILVFLILTFICTVYAFDELWQKAQEIAENSWRLVPGQTTMQISFREGRNEMRNMGFTARISHTLNEDNTIYSTLLSLENRGDTSSDEEEPDIEELSELREFRDLLEAMSKDMIPTREGMFFETDTRNIRVRRQNQTRRIGRRQCQAFEVRYSPSGRRSERIEGTVWLEIDTGVPVLAEMQIPMLNERRSSNVSYGYDAATNQYFTSRVEDTSTQTFYEVNYSVVGVLTYENYWEFPVE